MPNLKVLYLQNNEIVKKIPSYRKTVIAKIPTLMYLDDRPVFEEDRRHAEAYARGGIEAEREERTIIKKEKDERHMKNHEAFKEMMRKAREEKRQADEAKALEEAQLNEEIKMIKPDNASESKSNVEIVAEVVSEDDQPPELETVDIQAVQREAKSVRTDEEKQQEWLDRVQKQ